MVSKYDVLNGWVIWAAQHTTRRDIFLAGIGLINENGGDMYYAAEGYRVLFRDAEAECDGIPTYRQEAQVQKY